MTNAREEREARKAVALLAAATRRAGVSENLGSIADNVIEDAIVYERWLEDSR